MRKILVIQLAKMGDLLQSSPLIQAIKEKRPGASITLLASKKTEDIARMIPGVDEILGFDFSAAFQIVCEGERALPSKYHRFLDLLNGLRGRSFDDVYNLNHSDINANLMNLIRYRKAFCYELDSQGRRILKNRWLSYMFSILGDRRLNRFNLIDIYLHGSGLRSQNPSLSLRAGEESTGSANRYLARQGIMGRERLIGFQLGAGDSIRRWPVASYVRLVDLLVPGNDVRILLLGSPSERDLSLEFQTRLNKKRKTTGCMIDMVGKTTFQDLATFLARCDLVVTPDTGTMHLATAVGTQVVALFMGSAFCHETGPYGNNHFVLQPNMECYPCFQNRPPCTDYPCKKLISPQTVAEVIRWALETRKGQPPGRDPFFPTSRVRLLRSRIRAGFVEYVPVGRIPFSIEDVMALGYRAMWRSVLDDHCDERTAGMESFLDNCSRAPLSGEELREISGIEKDLGRLQSTLQARSHTFHEGDQLTEGIALQEERTTRWLEPILRFLEVEETNVRLSGQDADGEVKGLLSRLAGGAGFMSDFCWSLSREFST